MTGSPVSLSPRTPGMGWQLWDIPHLWHLWCIPRCRGAASGERETRSKITKTMRNRDPAQAGSAPSLCHHIPPLLLPQCPHQVTFPDTSCGANAVPLLRAGQDELGVPWVPAGSHSQADPGVPGQTQARCRSPPVLRERGGSCIHHQRFSWQRPRCSARQQLGEGVTKPGAGNAGLDHNPA